MTRGSIALLDSQTIGQIAAGEVVERPLSVVKELVENSLDAGAARITVSLERGGTDLVEVIDNGGGITPDDLRLAPARHATSKLQSARGLEAIETLGFRGEGLAAISAVARLRVVSRTQESDVGFAIEAFEQRIGEPEPVSAPLGTRVSVRDLFVNVPARREYLRSASSELARISAFLSTLALAYPNVAFSFRHDGRELWTLEPSATLERRLTHVFGSAASALIPLDAVTTDHARIRGFVSTPGNERGDRRLQLLFVNGRLLRTTQFAGVWSAAYASFAMQHRQPFGVLFVDVMATDVDPNVHPTKSDVRFRRGDAVLQTARRAIVRTLESFERARFARSVSLSPQLHVDATPAAVEAALGTASLLEGLIAERAVLRVIAHLDDTYIVASDGRALVLLDQHAAHERIAFEEIARRARNGSASEVLLVPYLVELSAHDSARFEEAREALGEAGLIAQPFGERCFRITSTPAGYGARRFELSALIADLGDEIPGLGTRERVWASLACHSVVRAHERLEPEEMATLVSRLGRCENPMHCPHGRPTVVRLEAEDLARLFKRS